MNSEFYNVALDRVRYSLVWEDSRTLYQALNLSPTDEVLVITSAGCNALNALLAGPRRVTALDLNPVQNHLLSFKCYLIKYHSAEVFQALLGLQGPAQVAATWAEVAPSLPTVLRHYWAPFFSSHPGGLLTAGRLETYLTGFLPSLDAATQAALCQLFGFSTVSAQTDFFERELHGTVFQTQFIRYFDEANLSKGRDPQLFRYAPESGGEAFYERLRHQLRTQLARDNFFLRFFIFGPDALPESLLPPCYQAHNFAALRERLPRLQIREGEAIDFLLSPAGRHVTKASLSNIFEYVSAAEFQHVSQALLHDPKRPLRLVFWNLLQPQGEAETGLPLVQDLAQDLTASDGCFYFRSVRVFDSQRMPVPVEQPRPLAYVRF
ncbi:S-adenosylmethionine-diacylglycerol 3-amino-3-carboxypropyl transferase [Hymenobacter gelipurpurascens]|uniref:S-adenosylmethionine-diacylglycerol 3-amino-3-carboxypropyl transferase n=1 Tax=Hymenobacter gelipurpurascens TaxID=89968 RepID=A0A212T065_9BACT|nr:DUF3419 family protein [Hymenobacter gelipurpurascens]SNC59433.1 S-adenosylmethionine-diacylglycerol 3-amino-3-carboxypropyl transferase [Hymenobacter gelipurpurascens]